MPRKVQNEVKATLDQTAESAAQFLNKFDSLPIPPKAGYDKYYNNSGFTNPKSPEGLSNQGLGKMLVKLTQVAMTRAANGDDEMKNILSGIDAWKTIAPAEIEKKATRDRLVQAGRALRNDPALDDIRKRWKKAGFDPADLDAALTADTEVPTEVAAIEEDPAHTAA